MEPTRTISVSEANLIDECVDRVRRALRRGSPEVAHKTIDWHFAKLSEVAEETPLELIGVNSRACEILYEAGVSSVEELQQLTKDRLRKIDNLGPHQIASIIHALAKSGLSLANAPKAV